MITRTILAAFLTFVGIVSSFAQAPNQGQVPNYIPPFTLPGTFNYTIPAGIATNATGITFFTNFTAPSTNPQGGFYLGLVTSAQMAANDGGVSIATTVTAAVSASSLTVSNVAGFLAGDPIMVMLDTGVPFSTLVNGTPSGSVINISPSLPSQVTSGNIVYDFKGHVQGQISSGILTSGATGIYGAEGFEANISVKAGASVFFKCVFCAIGNNDDAVQASGPWDLIIGLGTQSGGVAHKVGIGIGNFAGANPLNSASTVIQTFGASTVKSFLDFSSYSCSGGNEINFTNFVVDCVGNATMLRSSHSSEERDTGHTLATPVSGGTVTMAANTETALLDPAGTLATLTILLPPCAFTTNGYIARYSSTQALTALTVGTNGSIGTVKDPATSLAAGAGNTYICHGANSTYYRLL